MKINTTTLFLQSPNAITPIAWVNNQPDLSQFSEPTLSVLQKAWQDFLDSGEELEIIPDSEPYIEPPVANWDNFNGYMLSDPAYQQAVGTVLMAAPGLATALPAALSLVSSNGVGAFSLVWNAFCAVAQIPSSQRNQWGIIAEANNLPSEFIEVLKG